MRAQPAMTRTRLPEESGQNLIPVRIVIADDLERVRRATRALLSHRDESSVCGEAADGRLATEMVRQLRPDIVLMDVSMPVMSGIEAARSIRGDLPEIKVIIVSQNDPSIVFREAADVGASGYVLKNNLVNDLFTAIEDGTSADHRLPGAGGKVQP